MKILHFYHDILNLYGEYANVLALQKELEKKGAECEIFRASIGEEIDFSEYNFIYLGSGTERSQKAALEDIKARKKALSAALEKGAVILATGNSFEMFGKKITDKNGKEFEGLCFFDFTVKEGEKRIVEDIKAEFSGEEIIGFINKASEIFGVKEPFFNITSGVGNNSEEKTEGIKSGGFYGTHIIGPLLIRNEKMAGFFAETVLK